MTYKLIANVSCSCLILSMTIWGYVLLNQGDTRKFIFSHTREMAVYPYNIPCAPVSNIEYTITDPYQILEILTGGLDYRYKDGSSCGCHPNAYLYLRDEARATMRVSMVLDWSYLAIDGDWKHLVPLSPKATQLLRQHSHPCQHDK